MRILLIESDVSMAQSIELALKSEGMNVYSTDLGGEGIDVTRLYDYDVILTGLRFSDMNGFDVVKALRQDKINTPIIAIDRSGSPENGARIRELGANDYLVKPLHKDELIERVRKAFRLKPSSRITAGNLAINIDTEEVRVKDTVIKLTPTEYKILKFLALGKGNLVTTDSIATGLQKENGELADNLIKVFMKRIRKKTAAANDGNIPIHTIWGHGYQLTDADKPLRALQAGKAFRRAAAEMTEKDVVSTVATAKPKNPQP